MTIIDTTSEQRVTRDFLGLDSSLHSMTVPPASLSSLVVDYQDVPSLHTAGQTQVISMSTFAGYFHAQIVAALYHCRQFQAYQN